MSPAPSQMLLSDAEGKGRETLERKRGVHAEVQSVQSKAKLRKLVSAVVLGDGIRPVLSDFEGKGLPGKG